MCTATWWVAEEGYAVFFNRDELKTRLPEIQPREQIIDGTHCIAPCDADKGGTWLWVNEHGLTVGLLNRYPTNMRHSQSPQVSRGMLVRSLVSCTTVAQVEMRLRATDLSLTMPFTLFAVAGLDSCVLTWDTHALLRVAHAAERLPLTSSSYATERVEAARKHLFLDAMMVGESQQTLARLRQFHHTSLADKDGAYGVCMQRDDARTVSFSCIRVRYGRVATFEYQRRASQHHGFEKEETLELKLC